MGMRGDQEPSVSGIRRLIGLRSHLSESSGKQVVPAPTQLDQMTPQPNIPGEHGLSPVEVEDLRRQVSRWRVIEREGMPVLQRTFTFGTFSAALAFTNEVGKLAIDAQHYPIVVTEWGRVRVIWRTLIVRGLHRNDFILAAKTDLAYERVAAAVG